MGHQSMHRFKPQEEPFSEHDLLYIKDVVERRIVKWLMKRGFSVFISSYDENNVMRSFELMNVMVSWCEF